MCRTAERQADYVSLSLAGMFYILTDDVSRAIEFEIKVCIGFYYSFLLLFFIKYLFINYISLG